MEQFVIRDDYDGDTDDDDDDDDDTNLTTLEAWYSSNNHCIEQEKIQLEAENVLYNSYVKKKTLYIYKELKILEHFKS